MQGETVVLIVGAGPAGLATSACLNVMEIPNIVLEMEEGCASLWKERSYDRLRLHLAKEFCQLPHMSFPSDAPTFVSKSGFIQYLDDYVSHFKIHPFYNRLVQLASFDSCSHKWLVLAKNKFSGVIEEYVSKFLVVATGENSKGFVPTIPGLSSFDGVVMHSSQYQNGMNFEHKDVLVVGCGNSGMEIAYDLSNYDANASVVVRNTVHVLTKKTVQLGMNLLKFFPCGIVDKIALLLAKLEFGDLSVYGLQRPAKGPFYLKMTTGRSPVLDVGTIRKIKLGEIKVFPSVKMIDGDHIKFLNGKIKKIDAIIFATGYKSTVKNWLKEDDSLFNEDGMPKKMRPNHWKGDNGLYCVGFSSNGLFGISNDAKNITKDIVSCLSYGQLVS
ncbi:hypothetical protein M9H77_19593 [Catharanthus roseus]|uniref:Uncharacterized protein n=1 Tax=Catharanthus roseus TaxID=4058 RepID=A0ACC0BAQ3_CATRO|nr:hypothetical protein M9H77_19593 [Catharanthus roseus]